MPTCCSIRTLVSRAPMRDCARGPSGTFTASTPDGPRDRKSTRLNSSHVSISYAVFCLKKKKHTLLLLNLLKYLTGPAICEGNFLSYISPLIKTSQLCAVSNLPYHEYMSNQSSYRLATP